MAVLKPIPLLNLDKALFQEWGKIWLGSAASNGGSKKPNCFDKKQGMDFGKAVDPIVAKAIATMLGDIPVVSTSGRDKLMSGIYD